MQAKPYFLHTPGAVPAPKPFGTQAISQELRQGNYRKPSILSSFCVPSSRSVTLASFWELSLFPTIPIRQQPSYSFFLSIQKVPLHLLS